MQVVSRRSERRGTRDSNFSRYYNDVGHTKIIDAATEQDLFKRYREKGDIAARDRIIESCLRFVVKLAARYTDDIDRLKDLISAGNEGLLTAIDRFDPERNTRFLSYATHWVLLRIRNELNNASLVSMPLWYQKTVRKLNKVKTRVLTETGQHASDRQLCGAVGVTKSQLGHLRVDRFCYFTVEDMHLSNDGIESRTMGSETREMLQSMLYPDLESVKDSSALKLSPKESFIVGAYYGFVGDPWSLAQIANYLGISSERVRQIKEVALGQMREVLEKRKGVFKPEDVCP